jgi:SAM-dependent methyltransferase
MGLKIDLGCGTKKREEYIGVDMHAPNNPDIVADIRKRIRKLDDGCADEILCSHTLEHLHIDGFTDVLIEIERLLKPGGKFEFRIPHPSDDNAMIHSHVHVLTPHFWYHMQSRNELVEGQLIVDEIVEVPNELCVAFCDKFHIPFGEFNHFLRNAFTETIVFGHKTTEGK